MTIDSKDTKPQTDASNIGAAPLRVLVVDDSRAQRRVLSMYLNRWGYEVQEAASGEEALKVCANHTFDIILSDWMMGGLSGAEFCSQFRQQIGHESYAYFILLTSKSEKAAISSGLEAGADDFLAKPVSADELRARLRAGERIVTMQKELVLKNHTMANVVADLEKAQDAQSRDLVEARKLQQALVPELFHDWERGNATLFLRPSGHVGGDLVGFFQIDTDRIGIYSVDVSGHGVASAMMTARLAGYFSGGSPDQNLALRAGIGGQHDSWPPEHVAHRFNRAMLEDIQVEQYFTMAYAEVNLISGNVSMVQAGHPHPLILRANGEWESLGTGGMPIGLFSEATHERIEARLHPGDRLFLLSDGVTECPSRNGEEELGEEGLIRLLDPNKAQKSAVLLDSLLNELAAYMGSEDFPDDVSGLVFDYCGAPAAVAIAPAH